MPDLNSSRRTGAARVAALALLIVAGPGLHAQGPQSTPSKRPSGDQCNWDGWLPPEAARARVRQADPLTPASESALRVALGLGDKMRRDSVVRRLSAAREERTVDALLALLVTEPVPQVREGIIRSLGRVGNVRAAPPLQSWLHDSSSQTRAAAAWALGQLQDAQSLGPILAATHDSDKHVRDEATWALGLLGWSSQADARLTELLLDTALDVQQGARCGLNRSRPAEFPAGKLPRDLAVRHVTLIDGRGGAAQPAMTVVVHAGRIESVTSDQRAIIPRGAEVIDATGQYLIPGLWDMHVHLTIEGRTALAMYVASGVTGVRDMGGAIDTIRALRAAIAAGVLPGPRIVAAGPYFESPETVKGMRLGARDTTRDPPDRIAVADPESAARLVDSVAKLGVDFIKVRSYANPAVYWALAATARRNGLQLVGHPPGDLDPIAVADSGQRSIEHGFFPWKVDSIPVPRRDSIMAAFRSHGVVQVPTLVAWTPRRLPLDSTRVRVDGGVAEAHPWRKALSPGLLEFWRSEIDRFAKVNGGHPDAPGNLTAWSNVMAGMAHDIALMSAAGVVVLAGSDMAVGRYPGEGVHEELEQLVDAHVFSAAEAIVSATRRSAEFLRLADSLGTIERGKVADLVLLAANPFDDIRNLRRVVRVVQRGVSMSSKDWNVVLMAGLGVK